MEETHCAISEKDLSLNEWKDLIWQEVCKFEEATDSYFVKRDQLQKLIEQNKSAAAASGSASLQQNSSADQSHTQMQQQPADPTPFHNDESPLQGELAALSSSNDASNANP